MSSEEQTKTPEQTRRVLQEALEEHVKAVAANDMCDEECDCCDEGDEKVLLTSWFIGYEAVVVGASGPNGETVYRNSYCLSDCSPAQAIGVGEIGLGRLKQDLI